MHCWLSRYSKRLRNLVFCISCMSFDLPDTTSYQSLNNQTTSVLHVCRTVIEALNHMKNLRYHFPTCYMWQSRLETRRYVAILVLRTARAKFSLVFECLRSQKSCLTICSVLSSQRAVFWSLTDDNITFLDQDMLAQRCDISYMVCQM